MANYSFVVDSSFQPFTMQELMVPVLQYKDAYEKTEEAYDALNTKAGDFAYLSKTLPEGSQARQIYEGYAKDLEAQAKDLASKGLSMGNKRALVNLKRRYQGEIGRLEKADKALQEEKKLRRDMLAKDSSMLFADDNLDIDKYLDGSTPNNYSISGNELYTRGVNAAKAASSRMFNVGEGKGRTLGGYYRDWVERRGITPEMLREFGDQIREDFSAEVSSLPEFQQMANGILEERGVNENLSGYNLRRAQASVINGLIDGAIYEEKHNPVRDLGVMSAEERDRSAQGWASVNLQRQKYNDELQVSGFTRGKDGKLTYSPLDDVNLKQKIALAGVGRGSKGSGKGYTTQSSDVAIIGASNGVNYSFTDDTNTTKGFGIPINRDRLGTGRLLSDKEKDAIKSRFKAGRLQQLKAQVRNNIDDYDVYIYENDDNEKFYVTVPRGIIRDTDGETSNYPTTGGSAPAPRTSSKSSKTNNSSSKDY